MIDLDARAIERIIDMAWQDHISFEEIFEKCQVTEPQVIEVMRTHLKPKSFKVWRARVQGRASKHAKKTQILHDQQSYMTTEDDLNGKFKNL